MKPIFYRLMTTTPENAVKLAKNHLREDELEIALHSFKNKSKRRTSSVIRTSDE